MAKPYAGCRTKRWPSLLNEMPKRSTRGGAMGMTIVIVSGGIDLSVGSQIALGTVVTALILERVPGPVQLVGNSIGGVVALATAQRLEQQGRAARQVVLIDCALNARSETATATEPEVPALILRSFGEQFRHVLNEFTQIKGNRTEFRSPRLGL